MKLNKLEVGLIVIVAAFWIAIITFYAANPFHTATMDPRGRLFGHVPYLVPSGSMNPTLTSGELTIAATYVYSRAEPKRNDIVAFLWPPEPDIVFIKRIIGVPGDRLSMQNQVLSVNGITVDEPFTLWENEPPPQASSFDELVVPEGQYFVMGDNRGNSNDSRFWGFLPRDNIIGRVDYLWPASGIERLD